MRPERLLIERIDALDPDTANAARDTLCGVIVIQRDDAAPARVTMDGQSAMSLTLALTPCERAALASTGELDGAHVAVRSLPGALRLLPREAARR
jgi:hypothetical protein